MRKIWSFDYAYNIQFTLALCESWKDLSCCYAIDRAEITVQNVTFSNILMRK